LLPKSFNPKSSTYVIWSKAEEVRGFGTLVYHSAGEDEERTVVSQRPKRIKKWMRWLGSQKNLMMRMIRQRLGKNLDILATSCRKSRRTNLEAVVVSVNTLTARAKL
jgi:hypothetical protein